MISSNIRCPKQTSRSPASKLVPSCLSYSNVVRGQAGLCSPHPPASLLLLKSRPQLSWAACLEGSGSLCALAALSCLRSAQPSSPTASRPACPSACSAPGVLALSFPSTAAALRTRPSLLLFVDLSPAPTTVSGTQSDHPQPHPQHSPTAGNIC